MQKETGISHDAIVQESKKYWQNMEASAHGSQILGNQMKYGSLNLKMKFVCGQCWRNGQVNEPDRNKKNTAVQRQDTRGPKIAVWCL